MVAAALVLGACADDPPSAVDDSLARYASALSQVTSEYRRTVAELRVPDGGDAGALIGDAAVTMWSYVSAVTSLDPPDAAAAAHQSYLDAFTASAEYMNDATATLDGVSIEDMPDVLASQFGSTAAVLGDDVAAACADLQAVVTAAGIGVQLGCES